MMIEIMRFAKKFEIGIVPVLDLGEGDHDYSDSSLTGYEATLINSGEFDGMQSSKALSEIPRKYDAITPTTTYRLRDWLISRQKIIGERRFLLSTTLKAKLMLSKKNICRGIFPQMLSLSLQVNRLW